MKWAAFRVSLLVLLTACEREATAQSAEAEALDYVRLVQVALSNAYYQTSRPIPPTPCTDPLFGMKKTSKFLTLNRCTASMVNDENMLVTAVFNGDLAMLGNAQGVRRVKVSELPEVK